MAPFIAILFLAGVLASGCVIHDHGGGQGHKYGHHKNSVKVKPHVVVTAPAPITFVFTDHHRYTVRDYYHQHPRHHGKKHKKKHKWKHKGNGHGKGHLPPGLAKRDVLPPGIQMQAVHGDLVRQLPHPPHGTRYVYHQDQVLLIDVNTRVVMDFINISVSAEF
jgi:hypothetical protein